jgi:hypothetical protein
VLPLLPGIMHLRAKEFNSAAGPIGLLQRSMHI